MTKVKPKAKKSVKKVPKRLVKKIGQMRNSDKAGQAMQSPDKGMSELETRLGGTSF